MPGAWPSWFLAASGYSSLPARTLTPVQSVTPVTPSLGYKVEEQGQDLEACDVLILSTPQQPPPSMQRGPHPGPNECPITGIFSKSVLAWSATFGERDK